MFRYLSIGIAAILAAGCSTVPDLNNDPRSGGFFGGLAGVTRGDYKARQVERESALASVRGANQGLQQDNKALEQDRQRKQAEVAQLKQQVTKLNTEVGALSTKVAGLQKRTGSREASQLNQRVGDLERRTNALNAKTNSGDAPTLAQQKAQLEKEYSAALQTYLVLSDAGGTAAAPASSAGLTDMPR